MSARKLYTVVLAGGSGTRFWPFSREESPKQFSTIIGEHSMFRQTLARMAPLLPAGYIIVTNVKQAEAARAELVAGGFEVVESVEGLAGGKALVVAEPFGRNTAAAVAVAAALVKRLESAGLMCVLPSDHYISDAKRFRSSLETALMAAEDGWLTTLGIKPTRPETGYGYIRKGEVIKEGINRALAFCEKPDISTALQYLASGEYLWNSGMFCWRADVIFEELQRYLPELMAEVESWEAGGCLLDFSESLVALYDKLPSISIDYGVMEVSEQVAVMPVDFDWSDIGSWLSLWEQESKDKQGNAGAGGIIALDARNNLVKSDKEIVALVGVENLVVVETADALLVCQKDQSQRIKEVVEKLKELGKTRFL